MRRLPGRLKAEQVAQLLNCQQSDIPILVRAGLLKPLGNPVAKNSTKHFLTKTVVSSAEDERWMNRMTRTLSEHWRGKNSASKGSADSKAAA